AGVAVAGIGQVQARCAPGKIARAVVTECRRAAFWFDALAELLIPVIHVGTGERRRTGYGAGPHDRQRLAEDVALDRGEHALRSADRHRPLRGRLTVRHVTRGRAVAARV